MPREPPSGAASRARRLAHRRARSARGSPRRSTSTPPQRSAELPAERSALVADLEDPRERRLRIRPEPCVVDPARAAARLKIRQRFVDERDEPRLALRRADAHVIVRDRERRHFVVLLVRHVREQADQLRAVLRDRLHVARAQRGECERRVVVGDDRRLRIFLAQRDLVRRALVGADAQAVQLIGRFQHALLREKLLPRREIRHAEVDLLRTLVGDREVREHEIDLARGQERNAVRGIGRLQLQLDAEPVGERLRIVDVEADDPVRPRIDEAERRVAVERRDAQHAGLPDIVETIRVRGRMRGDERQTEEPGSEWLEFHWRDSLVLGDAGAARPAVERHGARGAASSSPYQCMHRFRTKKCC
ncbi:hypothetical protein Y046_3903 [Burkholderia pseudomallei MSHR2990]|nr:hypothetical protein Y046_3903 [Burkholderia pseudomallei MSHR2990]